MIEFSCDSCGRKIKVKDEFAGKKAKCPGCGEKIRVPEAGSPAPPAQEEKPAKPAKPEKAEARESGRPATRRERKPATERSARRREKDATEEPAGEAPARPRGPRRGARPGRRAAPARSSGGSPIAGKLAGFGSSGMGLVVVVLFFLPWISVSCQNPETGERVFSVSQTGLEAATGEYSLRVEATEEAKAKGLTQEKIDEEIAKQRKAGKMEDVEPEPLLFVIPACGLAILVVSALGALGVGPTRILAVVALVAALAGEVTTTIHLASDFGVVEGWKESKEKKPEDAFAQKMQEEIDKAFVAERHVPFLLVPACFGIALLLSGLQLATGGGPGRAAVRPGRAAAPPEDEAPPDDEEPEDEPAAEPPSRRERGPARRRGRR